MGGWMTYQRVRERNDLLPRKPDNDPDPYERDAAVIARHEPRWAMLTGDLNRMERDYLAPQYPAAPFAELPAGSDPAAECARATGVDIETVRVVLRYVFQQQP